MSKQSSSPSTYADLRAVFINTTLKRSPERSHTEILVAVSQEIMKAQGVTVEHVRAADDTMDDGASSVSTTSSHSAATSELNGRRAIDSIIRTLSTGR